MNDTFDNERELVAVRGVAFILRNAAVILASTVLLGLAGAGLGALASRGYESTASIEIGMRYPNEPLEMAIVARERLGGIIEKNRAHFPAVTSFKLENTRDAKTRSLTRLITAIAYSSTASSAQALLNDSFVDLLNEHKAMHEKDVELVLREKAHYARAEKRIEKALEALGESPEEPAAVLPGEKRPQLLSGALLEVQRLSNIMAAMSSTRRLPTTQIVEPPSPPERTTSRVWIFSLAGTVAGLLFGFSLAGFNELARPAYGALMKQTLVRPIEQHDTHRAP
jgi:hypothetical protein